MGKPVANWDALIEETTKPAGRCYTCQDSARATLSDLMATIHAKNAHKIGIPQIYDILEKAAPGFKDRVGFHAFRQHVMKHEPLWLRAKPKAGK